MGKFYCNVLMMTALALTLSFAVAATPSVQSVANVPNGATGIYRMNYLTNVAGQRRETLALWHHGTMKEVHTRTVGQRTYLNRTRTSQGIRVLPSKFNQLIALTGGLNVNVNTLPVDKQNQFYTLAGLPGTSSGSSGSSSVPTTVSDPIRGLCPQYTELKILNGVRKCVPLSYWFDGFKSKMLALWNSLELVPNAYAVLHFRFTMLALGRPMEWGLSYTDSYGGVAGVSAWEFNGFGFQVSWIDMPGA